MTKGLKLTIELVPASSWNNNLRSLLKPEMWIKLRNKVYSKHKFRCAICDSSTNRLHAHEVWKYDDKNHIQKLADIIALCPKCHAIKHIGFAGIKASEEKVDYENLIRHFMKVNKCDRSVFEINLSEAYKKFEERSKYEWQLELSKLKVFD